MCCIVYGLKTKFGGGKSTGFALIYDNEDYRQKYDSVPRLRKVRRSCFIMGSLDYDLRRESPES